MLHCTVNYSTYLLDEPEDELLVELLPDEELLVGVETLVLELLVGVETFVVALLVEFDVLLERLFDTAGVDVLLVLLLLVPTAGFVLLVVVSTLLVEVAGVVEVLVFTSDPERTAGFASLLVP